MTEIRTAIPEEIDRYLDAIVRTGPFTSKAELVRAALLAFAPTAGPMAHGFDRENVMAPDGRIYQVEYARESSLRGAPGVGLVYEGGVLLVGVTPPLSKLVKRGEKVKRIGDRVAVLSAGLVADAYMLIRQLQRADPQSTDALIDHLVEMFWQHTVDRTKRPLGTALLVGSTLGGEPRLLYFDPSGTVVEYEAGAVGPDEKSRLEVLEKQYRRGTAEQAEELALEALGRPGQYAVVRVEA